MVPGRRHSVRGSEARGREAELRKQLRRLGLAATLALLATLAASSVSRSAGSSSAAGHCTRAAADQIVLELDLQAEPGWKHPVAQVLCGAFLGPGVEAMAASVAIPSCGRTGNWLVFRYQDSRWRQVFESHNGAELVAVGTDIKETQNVLRPSDRHCFPTGGTRSRVWHWNGSRFTSTAWKYTKTPAQRAAKPSKMHYFDSPSHNIRCSSGDEGQAYCATNVPRRSVNLSLDGTVDICASRCSTVGFGTGSSVLGYGQVNEQGGFRCKSEVAGMTCTVMLAGQKGLGKGFRISRSGIVRVG